MLTIRPATPQDVPLILQFIRALAEYEREPAEATVTEADLVRDGFSGSPCYFCILASWNNEPAGFAFYFRSYSTWKGHSGIHLEDLFIHPHLRKQGIGKALITRVAAIAVEEGCPRMQWDVLKWNRLAIDFYEKLGAVDLTGWTTMRVTGDALKNLAAQSKTK